MSADPVEFFFRHAARHLAPGPHEAPWTAAADVFNRAYPHGMPMAEYARKTLAQARCAQSAHRNRMLSELARYRIADEVIAGEAGGASEDERTTLRRLRDAARGAAAARACPARRRPAPGSVVVARARSAPFTISNVKWASRFVVQRWMHHDDLESLVRRLAVSSRDEPLVIAVAGRGAFSPSHLAFSSRRRLVICRPNDAEHVDTDRVRRLARFVESHRAAPRAISGLRALCRARALTADIGPIDEKLLRYAERWGAHANELHDLVLRATDLEIRALAGPRED